MKRLSARAVQGCFQGLRQYSGQTALCAPGGFSRCYLLLTRPGAERFSAFRPKSRRLPRAHPCDRSAHTRAFPCRYPHSLFSPDSPGSDLRLCYDGITEAWSDAVCPVAVTPDRMKFYNSNRPWECLLMFICWLHAAQGGFQGLPRRPEAGPGPVQSRNWASACP